MAALAISQTQQSCRARSVLWHWGLCFLLLAVSLPAHGQKSCGTALKGIDHKRYEEAVAAYEQKDYDRCGQQMFKLAKRYPRSADVQFYAGLLSVQRDNGAAIRKYFGRVLSICPDYPDARVFLYDGIIRYSDEDYEGAEASLQRFFDSVNRDERPSYMVHYMEASNYLYWSQFLSEAQRHKVPFAPRLMMGASSSHDELMPYVTADGQEIYYVRYLPEEQGATFYHRELERKIPQLCMSRWKDTSYSAGTPLPTPFNTHESEGGVTLTADGRTLYLSAMTRTHRGYANYDIYSATLKDGHWGALEPAGKAINSETTWDAQPSVTADGQYIYFASNRPGGQGGIDIWRCRRLPNGDWSRAENLGPTVNTPGNEKCPFIHADGHTLYFASNGWQGFGGYDMYFINLDDKAASIPTNMGLPINGEKDDVCMGVTSDGRRAYYAGRHPERGLGGTDIIEFDLYPAAQPEPMQCCVGHVASADGKPLAAQLHVSRGATPAACYLTDSADGRFAAMLSLQASNLVWVTCEGYLPWASVGTWHTMGGIPERIVLRSAKVGARQPLPFAVEGGKLTPDQQRLMDCYVEFLLEHPMTNVRIEAPHQSSAKAIYDYLLTRSLRPSRLDYRGGGDVAETRIVITQK
ncbi:MAG: PD40 domain-containing protein [Bacteroidales bacterium]|nr:PD40 domain-containing protein [Bacteroidales bacterium]